MGKKGGKGKEVANAGIAEVAEIPVEQGESEAAPTVANEAREGEAPVGAEQDEALPAEAAEESEKKGKKKKEKAFDPLSDKPIKFKKIDFEHALTPEEKAAKKAEKLAAKKGDKKKKKAAAPAEAAPELAAPAEPTAPQKEDEGATEETAPLEEAAPAAEEEQKGAAGAKVPKKGKKEKGKKDKQAAKDAAPPTEETAPTEEQKEEDQEAAAATEKSKKGKKKGKKATQEAESPEEAKEEEEAGEGEGAKQKKGKKQKAKKGKKLGGETVDSEVQVREKSAEELTLAEEAVETSRVQILEPKEAKKAKGKKEGKKGKKLEGEEGATSEKEGKKGKGKGKKGKKGLESLSSGRLNTQMSISKFLERYASQQQMNTLADDEEWTWESYTPSTVSLQGEVKEKGKKGKGKGKKGKKEKKGKEKPKEEKEQQEGEAPAAAAEEAKDKKKKGKKGKKEKEKEKEKEEVVSEVAVASVPAGTDIMAEIQKMKDLAEAQARGDEEVEAESPVSSKKAPKKKKGKEKKEDTGEPKGPKKKLSKKERAKLAAEQAEQARIQAELDAKRAEEEERIRLIEERKAAIEKEKRETAEQIIRTEQLGNSVSLISAIRNHNLEKALQKKADREWHQFLKCDGLPDPFDCGQMNTYLHLWEKTLESTEIDGAVVRMEEVLKLLEVLQNLIDDPVGVEQPQIDNWKWVHRLFREHQQQSLDTATYRLLRDIQVNLHRINLLTADYQRKENNFALCLWLRVTMPTPEPNARKPALPRIQIDFPEMQMNVLFPISINCNCMAIRAMYLKYNHLNDLCDSYEKPPVPEQYCADLNAVTLEEWNSKLYYKYENRVKPAKTVEEGAEVVEATVDRQAGVIPVVPYQKLEPSASTYVIAVEDHMYSEIRQNLLRTVDEHVVNLRKYIILGGTYFLDLYYQPPQPKPMVSFIMTVTRLEVPKCLAEAPFYVRYQPPPPPDPTIRREPEEIEEEIKRQEEKLDCLMLVTLTLPDHVMWLDVPQVCHWDKERQLWTTEDVHDLKHIEEKGYLTFRTGRFGCFGLATNRYTNLPYQAWEMKPETDGTITLQITAAILLVEFNVKENLICVLQIQNSPNNALQEIVGVYYKLPKLIRILQEGGVDLFPAFDAFCYVAGTCEKHWPLERHLYYNMAQLSTCFNFAWSRWNITAGRRSIVMQMREYKPDKIKQVPHSMLHVTPLNAVFVDCTEVSQVFSDESVEGMHFYCDLFHLMKGTCPMSTRAKVQNTSYELTGAVANLLIATRVLSFS